MIGWIVYGDPARLTLQSGISEKTYLMPQRLAISDWRRNAGDKPREYSGTTGF